MKRYIHFFHLAGIMLGMTMLASCDDINSVHEKYLDRGESIYTGIVDSLTVESGNEKAKFRWMLNSDPRIKQVIIYWNNYTEYKAIDVHREKPGLLWMNEEIEFPEKDYVFYLMTTDGNGHQSMPVEKAVKIYGPKYVASLVNRGIKKSSVSKGKATLTWASISTPTLLYTTIKYTDNSGSEIEMRVENNSGTTTLEEMKSGDKIKIISTFKPEGSYVTFDAKETYYTLQ